MTVLDVNLLKLNSFDACAVKWSCYSLVTGSCAVVLCHSLHGWRIDESRQLRHMGFVYLLVSHFTWRFYRPQYKYYTWWHNQYVCHFMERRESAASFHFTWIVSILPLFKSVLFFFVSQWSVICGYLYWILASDSKFKEFWRFDCQIEICMFMKILYALTCICVFETWKAFWVSFV